MAKLRPDYENTWWPRLLRWLETGSTALDDALTKELEAQSADHLVDSEHHYVAQELALEERRHAALAREQRVYGTLHQWARSKGSKLMRWVYIIMSVVMCVGIIALLINTAANLPPYGSPDNPANVSGVSEHYMEHGLTQTGAVNIVAGMILDYRAFDTLGESNVLFVAAITVLVLLRLAPSKDGKPTTEMLEAEADDRMYEPKHDMILQHQANLLVPLILLFGIYVVMNGHISPGGGFSGGAIMGAGLILYLNAFGFKKTERFFTFTTFKVISVCSLAFYAFSKMYSFFTGANHLPSIITPGTPGMLFSAGLIPYLNISVGLVVCCTMYAFYTLFRKGDL